MYYYLNKHLIIRKRQKLSLYTTSIKLGTTFILYFLKLLTTFL